MFKNLFKKTKLNIISPIDGEVIPIEEVPDPVFSQKMMGEGIAIKPYEGNIISPIEGEVIQVAPTKHAIGMVTNDGTELLIHVGLETVTLKGKGFNVLVSEGDTVSVGQKLMEVNWGYVKNNAKSIMTLIVITNSLSDERKYKLTSEKTCVKGRTILLSIL